MPANKNALIRYKTIDNCLRNKYRRWTIDEEFVANPDFDSELFFDNVIGVSTSIKSYPRRIKFWASKEQSNYIKTKPLHHSQKLIQENPDGSCEFQINVVINFELISILLSYGSGVRVIFPSGGGEVDEGTD